MDLLYRDSLCLPQTSFPMKASLTTREPLILKKWYVDKLYQRIRVSHQRHKKYILHDGPPYANGHLHIGHAVNKVLKDIILKAKTLSGFDTPFIPGWDCHGLPIELNVEKQLKQKRTTYTPEEFRIACRQYAKAQMAIQKEEFIRLGILADWDNPYCTMDFSTESEIIRAFGQCITKGYVEQGSKPVHWCIACGSALAELEVEYQEKRSTAVDVKFQLSHHILQEDLPGKGPVFLPIWTTTPWTLPANEAVALGEKIQYCLIQTKHERFLLAHNIYQACLARYEIDNYTVLKHYQGEYFSGAKLSHPFEQRTVPLILSDHVDTDTGTGVVHIAPTHGIEDYELGIKYRLPMLNRVNTKGYYHPFVQALNDNQSVLEADDAIVDLLRTHQKLLCVQSFKHAYPHCWRHKIPLIFLTTTQWFLRLQSEKLHTTLQQAIEKIIWIPHWGKAKMHAMLGYNQAQYRPDWCISRQRHWGVPLPLFVNRYTRKLHPRTNELITFVAQEVEKIGIEAWHTLDINTVLGEEAAEYEKLTDTLDVWFDSGVTHQAVLKKEAQLKWPADLYLEGLDQFRGWFQSSLITSAMLHRDTPYKTVLVHGFTVDQQGKKMSKSLGNILSLDNILKKWGADILRLWIASVDTTSDIFVSEEVFQRISESYRRIRNTVRFLIANLHDFDPLHDQVKPHALLSLDRWLIMRTAMLQEAIRDAYEKFSFRHIYQMIHQFCIDELGSFYLSILKDRQYTMQQHSMGRRSGQTAMYHVTEAILRWLAPILSFTMEEAWQHLPGKREESIFLSQWYVLSFDETSDTLVSFYREQGGCQKCWDLIRAVRDTANKAIEKARDDKKIGSSLEANLVLFCKENSFIARLLSIMQKELHFIFLTSTVQILYTRDNDVENNTNVAVEVRPININQKKCIRCWHRLEEVGQNLQHPKLCSRCILNLFDNVGEKRHYA